MKQVAGSFGGLYAFGLHILRCRVACVHRMGSAIEAVIHLLQYFDIWTYGGSAAALISQQLGCVAMRGCCCSWSAHTSFIGAQTRVASVVVAASSFGDWVFCQANCGQLEQGLACLQPGPKLQHQRS